MTETALAVVEDRNEITISETDVKKFIAPNATDKELYMFMNIARSYGLNPFKREIHFVKYGNSAGSIIVGYETYLKRAERTGKLDGWTVKILDKGKKDTERAEITIFRKDRKEPFVWEVFRSEFDKQQSVWKSMPQFMLKKVAIAQGFRLAFPEEIGGMPYIPEEISANNSESLPSEPDQEFKAEDKPPEESQPRAATGNGAGITKAQRGKIWAMMKEKEMADEEAKALYEYVLAGNEASKAWASDFIENFETHFNNYLDSASTQEQEQEHEEDDIPL